MRTTFVRCVEQERSKADFVFSQFEVFRIESDGTGHNPYSMLPPTDEHKWKLFAMSVAHGDALAYRVLLEETPYSELVERYALDLTLRWRPKDNP